MNHYSTALSPSNFSSEHIPTAFMRQIHKDACEVVRAVAKGNIIENGLAMVQITIMNNVANLSMLEQQLSEMAPTSELRLKMLVDNYTYRADKRMGGN